MRGLIYISAILCLPMVLSADEMTGDPVHGKSLFEDCSACHQIGAAAENTVGPILNHIVGQGAGAIEGFEYSEALVQAATDGLIWTPENLDAFIENPAGFIPETTMPYGGMDDPQNRADLIAFLETISGDEGVDEVGEGFAVSDEILALTGDKAYGAYLASECTTCHQADGGDDGIPNIVGWKQEDFVTVMHAYREKYLTNSTMQVIAGRLSDEEIAGLAVYFENPE